MGSQGVKRSAATLIGTLVNFIYALFPWFPGLGTVAAANGVLGLTGLLHSTASETLLGNVAASIGAALTVLYAVAEAVPVLKPYAPIIAVLINVFGGAVVAKSLSTRTSNDSEQ